MSAAFRADGPATIAPEIQTPDHRVSGDFRCGICNKTYSRRDLRDRHRRRCIKTAGKERLSKRKSCETCAQKKLRCSMTRPACTRCVRMTTPCCYPPSSLPPRIPDHQETLHTSSSSSANHTGSLVATGLESDPTPSHFDPGDAAAWNPFGAADMGLILCELDGSLFTPGGSLPWGDDFISLTDPMSAGSTLASNIDESNHTGSSYFLSFHENSKPVAALEAPPPGALAGDTYNASPDHVPSLSSTSADSAWDDPSNREDIELIHLGLQGDSSTRLTLGDHFVPKVGPLTQWDTDETYRELFAVLRDYTGLILEREYWSAFVHHHLYRCSMGGLAQPMGTALACVSVHTSSVESSDGFVDRMIHSEREKLIREFYTHIDTPETCLAAVHAVCLYQILGLFGDNFFPAASVTPRGPEEANDRRYEEIKRTAELYSPFLLTMARRLYKLHQRRLVIHHTDENDWERWKFMESLRRNIFFVNMINILGTKTRPLNEQYFEPLGDDIILQLPLPAPEHMWRCSSEEEWMLIREHLRQSLKLSDGAYNYLGPRTLGELLAQDQAGTLDVSSLLPITRLILACGKVAPRGGPLGDL
ncbi:hypothetical protein BDV28DRAFT_148075 [Aspergillus coremiiformis]|uniref:Uncharacterized protein n=1 Tax=Aspergillus coremiiformis TaxID=138285 RepID=A0A5N6Z7L2_9EURO|nr:hypothetical protein BDV28DRAFT_148075 [Aspergillus coremiiformis]